MSSETLAAAAEVMGVPESLVQRSAQARAQAGGIAVDDVLGAWSGGAAVAHAAAPAPAAATPEPEPVPEAAPAAPAATPDVEPALTPAQVQPAGAAAAVAVLEAPVPEGAPVLTGRRESAGVLLAGVAGLFLIAVLLAMVLPALDGTPATPPPSGLSELGVQGREVYVAEGCWYCHTQQVRPIVADANLGPVTRADLMASFAPDTLGIQRIGPDLAHAGSREPTSDPAWLAEFLADPRSVNEDSLQPAYGHLSEADLSALVQYLVESR